MTASPATELWKSDGTATGTVRVKDIQPGPIGSAPSSFTEVGAIIFFTANDGATGTEAVEERRHSSWNDPVEGHPPRHGVV